MASNYSTIQEGTASLLSITTGNALILLKAEESLIQVSWKSSPVAEELAECADFLSLLITEHNIHQLLHDVRNLNYIDIDVQRSLSKVFCPKLIEAGISKMVHLANYALPDLMILDQITNFVKNKFTTGKNVKFETCTTPEGAAEWFKNVLFKQPATIPATTEVIEVATNQTVVVELANELKFVSALKTYKEKVSFFYKLIAKRKPLYS